MRTTVGQWWRLQYSLERRRTSHLRGWDRRQKYSLKYNGVEMDTHVLQVFYGVIPLRYAERDATNGQAAA